MGVHFSKANCSSSSRRESTEYSANYIAIMNFSSTTIYSIGPINPPVHQKSRTVLRSPSDRSSNRTSYPRNHNTVRTKSLSRSATKKKKRIKLPTTRPDREEDTRTGAHIPRRGKRKKNEPERRRKGSKAQETKRHESCASKGGTRRKNNERTRWGESGVAGRLL